jgi:putative transcriptional regulator
MHDGDLAAKPKLRAPSSGRAVRDAEPGDEVVVTDLAGLVDLEPGRLSVIAIPSPSEGGIARVDAPRLRAMLREAPRADRTGAVGTGARILARRLGELHFDFAADRAAFNAAERGLGARLFVARDRLPEVMQAFDEMNARTLRRVTIDVADAPETRA